MLYQQPIPATGNAEEKELIGTVDFVSVWLCSSRLCLCPSCTFFFAKTDYKTVMFSILVPGSKRRGLGMTSCYAHPSRPRQVPRFYGRRQPSHVQCQEDCECLSCLDQLALCLLHQRPEAQVDWEQTQEAPTQFNSNHCLMSCKHILNPKVKYIYF